MPRGNQLVRQWRILRAVEASRLGRTAVELHDEVAELGSLRTVYRDLEALQGCRCGRRHAAFSDGQSPAAAGPKIATKGALNALLRS